MHIMYGEGGGGGNLDQIPRTMLVGVLGPLPQTKKTLQPGSAKPTKRLVRDAVALGYRLWGRSSRYPAPRETFEGPAREKESVGQHTSSRRDISLVSLGDCGCSGEYTVRVRAQKIESMITSNPSGHQSSGRGYLSSIPTLCRLQQSVALPPMGLQASTNVCGSLQGPHFIYFIIVLFIFIIFNLFIIIIIIIFYFLPFRRLGQCGP